LGAPRPVTLIDEGHLRHIDGDLAQRVADGLGMDALPPAPKAAAPVIDMPPSPALQIIGKMKKTLEGRCDGILVDDGSDGATVATLRKAAEDAGATAKIVAPKVGGAMLARGKKLPADGQLAGTPSVVFDAVALVLSEEAGQRLASEAAAVDFVREPAGAGRVRVWTVVDGSSVRETEYEQRPGLALA
jgi:catalase